jgi:hypothetical protein
MTVLGQSPRQSLADPAVLPQPGKDMTVLGQSLGSA